VSKRTDGPSAAVRIRVYKRDRFTCTYCGISGQEAELEVDHIIPVALKGSHHMSNLTTSCRLCNQAKGAGVAKPRNRADVAANAHIERHPLVGLYLHTFKTEKIHYQGMVYAVDGDNCLVQLFSWMDGRPTNIEVMPKSKIYSSEVKLYKFEDEWRETADRESRKNVIAMERELSAKKVGA
jgi:hypothetical protein